MIERQRLSSGLFANIGAAQSETEATQSPVEMHSDILTADDLPREAVGTTPLKNLTTVGPMDVFLGSSPTPHARRSTRHIGSGSTGITTPIAIRSIQLDANDDLGSSPPQFRTNMSSTGGNANNTEPTSSSFGYRAPEERQSLSFDEGTTIDDEAMLAVEMEEAADGNVSTNIIPEQSSPNVDRELTAQIDADMQAHIATASQRSEEDVLESNNDFVDATSHPLPSPIDQDHPTNDKEVEDSQNPSHTVALHSDIEPDIETSDISCVGDSFIKSDTNMETPKTQTLRRSSRRLSASSPALSAGGKGRKQTPAKQSSKSKDDKKEPSIAPSEDEVVLDNITVALPKKKPTGKKRKSTGRAQSPSDEQILIPETNRKRETRRSQSLLNQVENSQDIVVEDTPAFKRARQSMDQDVSAAKNNPTLEASRTNRLSHVQVTPKRSPENKSTRESLVAPEIDGSVSGETDHSTMRTPDVKASRHRFEESIASQEPSGGTTTPARSFTERVILTPRSIINQLKNLKDYLFSAPQLVLRREEEREVDDILFGIRMQVHAAGRRGEDSDGGQQ